METLKIAVVQQKSIPRNFAKNIELSIAIMNQAKCAGAELVLFPECFITGYELPISNEEALSDGCIFIKEICDKAAEIKIGVVITALTKGKEKARNSAFLIDKSGTIIMKYDKVHTCDFSYESCLESGEEFMVSNFHGVNIGIMICYDREYPESARVLMMKGAEVILVPNDCGSMRPRVQALSTRAYENMVGVAMANPPGINAGCSCAFSPICWDKDGNCIDNTIFIADEMSSGVYYAEFDLEKLRNYRRSEMMGNTFRKVKAYSELFNTQIKEPFIRT